MAMPESIATCVKNPVCAQGLMDSLSGLPASTPTFQRRVQSYTVDQCSSCLLLPDPAAPRPPLHLIASEAAGSGPGLHMAAHHTTALHPPPQSPRTSPSSGLPAAARHCARCCCCSALPGDGRCQYGGVGRATARAAGTCGPVPGYLSLHT